MNALRISGELRLQDAPALMQRLDEALAGGCVRVDVSGLAGADVAVLQVLVSASHTARLTGRSLTLAAAPNLPLAAHLAALGLSPADLGGTAEQVVTA